MGTWLTRSFAVAAIGFVATAACLAVQSNATPDPQMEVRAAEQDLGAVPAGKRELIFPVFNPSGSPRRVLNTSEGCGNFCCFGPKHRSPMTVPPGGTFDCVCEFTVQELGPFSATFAMFPDDNGLRTVMLTVRGIRTAPEGQASDPNHKP